MQVYVIQTVLEKKEGSTGPSPYRTIAVPENTTLFDLALTITEQFGLEMDQPFGFYDNLLDWRHAKRSYELFADMEEPGSPEGVKSVHVDTLFSAPGTRFLFLYDFNEEHRFAVELKETRSPMDGESYPVIEDAFGVLSDSSAASSSEEDGWDGTMEDAVQKHYYDLEEEALQRVREVFSTPPDEELPGVSPVTLEIYYDYIRSRIEFPFHGVFGEQQKDKDTIYHDVEVTGLMDLDDTPDPDKYGIICHVILNGVPAKMPLAEIVINQGEKHYNLVEDFCIWYWKSKS